VFSCGGSRGGRRYGRRKRYLQVERGFGTGDGGVAETEMVKLNDAQPTDTDAAAENGASHINEYD